MHIFNVGKNVFWIKVNGEIVDDYFDRNLAEAKAFRLKLEIGPEAEVEVEQKS